MKWTFNFFIILFGSLFINQYCYSQVTVSAGEDLFICEGESIELQGIIQPAGTPFAWTIFQGDPNSLTSTNVLNPIVNPFFPPTYILTASTEIESATDTVTVNVSQQPNANAGEDAIICGLTFNLNAEESVGIGFWSTVQGDILFNEINNSSTSAIASIPGSYEIIWSVANFGCTDADTITITILPGPVEPNLELKFCALTDSIEFDNIPYPFVTIFSWDILDNAPITLSNNNSAEPGISSAEAGDFELVLNQLVPESNCERIDTISVKFLNHENINILDIEESISVCAGERLLLNYNGIGSVSFFPSNIIEEFSDNNVIIRPLETGFFKVTRIQDFCESSDSLYIETNLEVGTAPDFKTDYFCEGVRFIAIDTNSNAVRSTWIFEGDTLQTAPIFEKDFNSSITITLLSEDNTGCLKISEGSITAPSLVNNLELDIPNVFSPNGDGVNDVFSLGDNLFFNDCVEMFIYNRSGKLIFSSNGGLPVWNGFDFTGQRVPTGTYFYILKFPDSTIKGSLSLFR